MLACYHSTKKVTGNSQDLSIDKIYWLVLNVSLDEYLSVRTPRLSNSFSLIGSILVSKVPQVPNSFSIYFNYQQLVLSSKPKKKIQSNVNICSCYDDTFHPFCTKKTLEALEPIRYIVNTSLILQC